ALLHRPAGRIVVAAVAVDVLADLAALPTRVRVGQWLDVRAVLRVPASDAKLVVLGPRGAPHAVPTSFADGQARARFNADSPGPWLVQLLAAVDGGPRPLLEAWVFAGTEPPSELSVPKAPGEEAAQSSADPSAALYTMVNAARQSERLPPLTRDARLEELARAHAEAMRRARKTAHDAGDGDLNQRLEQQNLQLAAGENVAHAGSATLAQRALWASPSHRENLLFPSFDLVGIGVAPDPDGTLWVCQVFGTSP
ncbi:MAG TPA: CAP domain-containing protein, partial [Polyangiaceae bacterium]